MIRLKLNIDNPWGSDDFRNIWSWHKKLAKTKAFEIQLSRYSRELFGINIDLNWVGRDHAGPEIEVIFATFSVRLNLYDSRHWDYEKRTWEKYEETYD